MNSRPSDIDITVTTLNPGASAGFLECAGLRFPCALGRGGLTSRKLEGDGATPLGRWQLRHAWYRPDRISRPRTGLPLKVIKPQDGWCDAPGDRNYNRPVNHPYPASAEHLWRKDHLYDLVVAIGYNDLPRSRGRGSAIFMHVAGPNMAPTEGCVALRRDDLIRLISLIGPSTQLHIGPYHWR